jgi:cell division protein FtsB
MRNFQHKKGFGHILHSKPVLVLLGLLVLFFAWGVVGFLGKMEITRENRILAENKVADLQKQKDKLTSDIAKLNTPGGIDDSIRQKFGLAKDGEGEIVVVDDKTSAPAPEPSSGGFWGFLKNLFK